MTDKFALFQSSLHQINLAPGAETSIQLVPRLPTVLESIEHTGAIDGVEVTSLRIGLHEQFMSPIPVRLDMLIGAVNRDDARLDALAPHRPITMSLRNAGHEARAFEIILHTVPVVQ